MTNSCLKFKFPFRRIRDSEEVPRSLVLKFVTLPGPPPVFLLFVFFFRPGKRKEGRKEDVRGLLPPYTSSLLLFPRLNKILGRKRRGPPPLPPSLPASLVCVEICGLLTPPPLPPRFSFLPFPPNGRTLPYPTKKYNAPSFFPSRPRFPELAPAINFTSLFSSRSLSGPGGKGGGGACNYLSSVFP